MRHRLHPEGERGAVLVWFAVLLGTIILFVAFVIDIGNFYVHKRHLQLQADAAALAGGTLWGACIGETDAQRQDVTSAANTNLIGVTRTYGGDPNATAPYNVQIGATQQKAPPPTGTGTDPDAGVHLLVNSTAFWNHGGTDYSDSGGVSGAPCSTKFVDVKVTESKLDSFFNTVLGFLNLVPSINAHARVELKTINGSGGGALPIGVPNPKPKSGAVLFIDEANANQIFKTSPLNDLNAVQNGLALWATPPVQNVSIPSSRVGVVVILSGLANVLSTIGPGDTLATICARQLNSCYDANAANGLLFVRGASTAVLGLNSAPILRGVQLFTAGVAGACPHPYFYLANAACPVGIEARVDATVATSSLGIFAIAGSCPTNGQNTGCALAVDPNQASAECAGIPGTGTCWRGTLTGIPANAGAQAVTMNWSQTSGTVGTTACGTGGQVKPCTGGFNVVGGAAQPVQRTFSAVDTRSGPLELAELYNCDADPTCAVAPKDLHSYPVGSTHTFSVKVGIRGNLENAQPGDPPVALRLIGGSQNQSLDCVPPQFGDPANPFYPWTNLYQELAGGCQPNYIVNDGAPDCGTVTPPALWGSPQPWECVALQTGNATNQVPRGLNWRVLGSEKPTTCPPNVGDLGHNNWSLFDPAAPNAGFPAGDPRIIEVFLTPFGTFTNSGNGTVPITGFAVFYLTGWTGKGGGFDNPCQVLGSDDLVPGDDPKTILGHFIKYIGSFGNGGGGGGDLCDFSDFAPCTPVLTQ